MDDLYESDNEYAHGRALFIAFLILMPILCLLPRWLFHYVAREHVIVEERNRTPTGPVAQALEAFPAPKLQPEPRADLEAFKSQQLRELTSYGWIDKERGLARIPIEEAINRYLATKPQPGAERKP